jgi:hypothetical protein
VQEYVVPFIAHLLEDGHVQESILDSVSLLAGPEMGASIKSQVSALIKLPLPITTIKAQVRPLSTPFPSPGQRHRCRTAKNGMSDTPSGPDSEKKRMSATPSKS